MKKLILMLCLFGATVAAQAQTLKPGDSLSISVLQDAKLDRSVVVDPSGQMSIQSPTFNIRIGDPTLAGDHLGA